MTLTFGDDQDATDSRNLANHYYKVTNVEYPDSPGNAGKTNPYYVARPWAGFSTRNVAGDALVSASSKRDPGFQPDNAVDGLIGYFKPETYRGSGDGQVSEWHTASNDSARWIRLNWDRPQRIHAVLLSDRASPTDNVSQVTFEFGSGQSVQRSLGPNNTRGEYAEYQFPG